MACFQRFVYLTIIANKVQPNIVLFGIITNRCDFELKKNHNDNDLCLCKSMANLSNIPYICKHANDESGHFCIVMNRFNSTVT